MDRFQGLPGDPLGAVQDGADGGTTDQPELADHAVVQVLAVLCDHDLIYKNRHGRYSFAIPLLDRFVRRQFQPGTFAPETNCKRDICPVISRLVRFSFLILIGRFATLDP